MFVLDIGENSHVAYLTGYKMAADSLSQNIDGSYTKSLLAYPILFLYRHSLELQLKLIIHHGRLLLDEGDGFPIGHSLSMLWSLTKALIKKVDNNKTNLPKFKLIDGIVREYSALDPKSMVFRYAKDKNGNQYLPNYTPINFVDFIKMIKQAGFFLEEFYMEITNALTVKEDLDSHYKRME